MEDVTTRSNRVQMAAGLWVVQLAFAFFACVLMFFSQFSVASCTATTCDYSLYAATINAFYIGAAVLLVAAALGIWLSRRHDRAVLWSPLIGIILTLVLLVVTYAASRSALDLPLFGNRL